MAVKLGKSSALAIAGGLLLTTAAVPVALYGTISFLQNAALAMTAMEYATKLQGFQLVGGGMLGLGVTLNIMVAVCVAYYSGENPLWFALIGGMVGLTVTSATILGATGMAEQLVVVNIEAAMNNAYIATGVLAAVGAVCLIGAFALYSREKMAIAKLSSDPDERDVVMRWNMDCNNGLY